MGDDEWGHKVSNFRLIIVRINGGLTGVIRPRRVVRAKVSVIQRKILSAFAHNQVFSGLIFEPDSPQITDYLVPDVRAIRKFQIVRIEIGQISAILFEPGYGIPYQSKFVSDVV